MQELLSTILAYHVIPDGAYFSSNLTDGQNLTTALMDVPPLTVSITPQNITFVGGQTIGTVLVPNITAGASVIHVIDGVLLPTPPSNADVVNADNSTAMPGAAGY